MNKGDWIKKLEAKPGRETLNCVFCNLEVEDECQYGKLYCKGKITAHYYCLLLATKLDQKGSDREGILGFQLKDIEKHLHVSKRVRCCYCRKGGATVYCCGITCKKVFHLPCGLKEQSFHEFYGRFRSYCNAHRKVQNIDSATLREASRVTQICTICYDTVVPKPTPETLWAPCCKKNAWFHKACVQNLALSAGYFFKCPLCNNKRLFHNVMRKYGVFIPEQDASWERVPHAFDDMYIIYRRCDAVKCQCKKGRSYNERRTAFEILVCKYCGSQGVHKKCEGLKQRQKEWGCPFCTNAVASGCSQATSAASDEGKPCSGTTFNVQEFFSSSISKRYLPLVLVERDFTVPPSIQIGETSLEILQGSYHTSEISNTPTTSLKPQVFLSGASSVQYKNGSSGPGCSLWEEEGTLPCSLNNTDDCKRTLTDCSKRNVMRTEKTISSDSQRVLTSESNYYLKKKEDLIHFKSSQGTKKQTSLLEVAGISEMNTQNGVNDLPDSIKKRNVHGSSFHKDMVKASGSTTEVCHNATTDSVVATDVASPESKKIKKDRMCGSSTFVISRELKHLGIRRKHIYLSKVSFTRSGISYLT